MPKTSAQATTTPLLEPLPSSLVTIHWVFFDPKSPHDTVLPADISLEHFTRSCVSCRQPFVDLLLEDFGFVATESSIEFWQPNQDLSFRTVCRRGGWTKKIKDFRDAFTKIVASRSFKNALKRVIDNGELVHLVVTAEGYYKNDKVKRIINKWNGHREVPQVRRYLEIISTYGRPPHGVIKPTVYAGMQAQSDEAIYDGLFPPYIGFATDAPPVEIFHPAFRKFVLDANDTRVKPPPDVFVQVQELMAFNSTIQTVESLDNHAFQGKLESILTCAITEELDVNKGHSNRIVAFESESGIRFPLLIIERQGMLGEEGCDPSIQVAHSMRRAWLQPDRAVVRDHCCCPTLLLASAGPWLCVLGGVFTDKFIVQRLTDMMWTGLSSTNEYTRVYHVSRVLMALRDSLKTFEAFYRRLSMVDDSLFAPRSLLRRFYPYPTYFLENCQKIHFEYLNPMQDDQKCRTFLARIQDVGFPKIVVKFVDQYGEGAHECLAAKGFGPTLRYFGRLLGDDPPSDAEIAPGTTWNPSMRMVVTDFVEPHPYPPLENVHEQIRQALTALHLGGFVYGDLRGPNVLFDSDGKIKLIDFDWAGRYDMDIRDDSILPPDLREAIIHMAGSVEQKEKVEFACYPMDLSMALAWPPGVSELVPIRPWHDWDMLYRVWRAEGMRPNTSTI